MWMTTCCSPRRGRRVASLCKVHYPPAFGIGRAAVRRGNSLVLVMEGLGYGIKMTNSSITVKLVETPAELEAAFSLRIRVFVGEQGVPANIELDELDTADDTVHAVALHDGVVIGTGRLLPDVDGKGPHIGRMAVEQDRRRGGVGGQVLRFLEEQGRERGFRQITLHAQEYVKSFYAGHGYREVGEVFEEAGIPHREMVKEL